MELGILALLNFIVGCLLYVRTIPSRSHAAKTRRLLGGLQTEIINLRNRLAKHSGQLKRMDEQHIKIKVAEKVADKAFTLANSAHVGIAILQRSLPTRKPWVSKQEDTRTKTSLKEMEKQDPDSLEMLLPFLTEQDRELLEIAKSRMGTLDDEV